MLSVWNSLTQFESLFGNSMFKSNRSKTFAFSNLLEYNILFSYRCRIQLPFLSSWDMTAHVKKQPMCRIDLLTSIWLKSKQCLLFHEKNMKSFHCMSHLPEVFASRDREKAYYIAGVLVIRGPSYAKFFCLNRVSKFKGPRKSVLHSGPPSYPVYPLSRVYCNVLDVKNP